MVNIAVFASGSGTNFETILSHIEDGSLHVNCACLIVDKENAYARDRACGVEEGEIRGKRFLQSALEDHRPHFFDECE